MAHSNIILDPESSSGSAKSVTVTTPQLLAAHTRSLEARQNRLLTDEFLDSLDPEGVHVVLFTMWHENYEGTKGVRTHLFCKTRDAVESVLFDFMVEDYMALVVVR